MFETELHCDVGRLVHISLDVSLQSDFKCTNFLTEGWEIVLERLMFGKMINFHVFYKKQE